MNDRDEKLKLARMKLEKFQQKRRPETEPSSLAKGPESKFVVPQVTNAMQIDISQNENIPRLAAESSDNNYSDSNQGLFGGFITAVNQYVNNTISTVKELSNEEKYSNFHQAAGDQVAVLQPVSESEQEIQNSEYDVQVYDYNQSEGTAHFVNEAFINSGPIQKSAPSGHQYDYNTVSPQKIGGPNDSWYDKWIGQINQLSAPEPVDLTIEHDNTIADISAINEQIPFSSPVKNEKEVDEIDSLVQSISVNRFSQIETSFPPVDSYWHSQASARDNDLVKTPHADRNSKVIELDHADNITFENQAKFVDEDSIYEYAKSSKKADENETSISQRKLSLDQRERLLNERNAQLESRERVQSQKEASYQIAVAQLQLEKQELTSRVEQMDALSLKNAAESQRLIKVKSELDSKLISLNSFQKQLDDKNQLLNEKETEITSKETALNRKFNDLKVKEKIIIESDNELKKRRESFQIQMHKANEQMELKNRQLEDKLLDIKEQTRALQEQQQVSNENLSNIHLKKELENKVAALQTKEAKLTELFLQCSHKQKELDQVNSQLAKTKESLKQEKLSLQQKAAQLDAEKAALFSNPTEANSEYLKRKDFEIKQLHEQYQKRISYLENQLYMVRKKSADDFNKASSIMNDFKSFDYESTDKMRPSVNSTPKPYTESPKMDSRQILDSDQVEKLQSFALNELKKPAEKETKNLMNIILALTNSNQNLGRQLESINRNMSPSESIPFNSNRNLPNEEKYKFHTNMHRPDTASHISRQPSRNSMRSAVSEVHSIQHPLTSSSYHVEDMENRIAAAVSNSRAGRSRVSSFGKKSDISRNNVVPSRNGYLNYSSSYQPLISGLKPLIEERHYNLPDMQVSNNEETRPTTMDSRYSTRIEGIRYAVRQRLDQSSNFYIGKSIN